MYEKRQFAIFETSELSRINWSEVLETSADTARKSVDGSKCLVKWDGDDVPASVQSLTTVEDHYTYTEIMDIINGPEWTCPMETTEIVNKETEI